MRVERHGRLRQTAHRNFGWSFWVKQTNGPLNLFEWCKGNCFPNKSSGGGYRKPWKSHRNNMFAFRLGVTWKQAFTTWIQIIFLCFQVLLFEVITCWANHPFMAVQRTQWMITSKSLKCLATWETLLTTIQPSIRYQSAKRKGESQSSKTIWCVIWSSTTTTSVKLIPISTVGGNVSARDKDTTEDQPWRKHVEQHGDLASEHLWKAIKHACQRSVEGCENNLNKHEPTSNFLASCFLA